MEGEYILKYKLGKLHIFKIAVFLICFVAITAYATENSSAVNTDDVSGYQAINVQNSPDSGTNSVALQSSVTSAEDSSTESASIDLTNEFRNANNPEYPNPGNVIDHSNYYSWVWSCINITNNGPDNAMVTIKDTGSNGFVYYNPSIGWNGYVRFNNGTGWVWDNNFDVKTGTGTYSILNGATYQVAILGYVNQTGTITNTVNQISQDIYSPEPYPTVSANLHVPSASIIRLNNEFRSTVNGEAISSASYRQWVYSVTTTTNSGPDTANARYQFTSTGFTPNGTYGVSKDNGVTWVWNDGSYNTGTGVWNINIPSNAKYLLAIYGQITGSSTISSTTKEIYQDTYNPYGAENARPKVLIVFDDGNIAQYNIAFKYMQSKGIIGTAYINGYNIGQSGVVSLANLLEMHTAGWVIANHAYVHQNFLPLTNDEIRYQISEQINFLISNGFTSGAYHLAYPGGYSDQDVYDIMNDLGVKTGRTVVATLIDNLNAFNLYQIPAYTIVNSNSVSTVKGYINNAIATDSTVVLLFHNIKDSNPGTYEYLTSNFKSIIDYIASTGIDCLTINDLYQQTTVAPINIPSNRTVNTSGQSTSNGYASASASIFTTPPVADVSVTQTTSNSKPNYLENVTFTIKVTNLGPSAAENVTAGDWLNGNYLIWISDDSGGSYNPATGVWTIGTLESGVTKTLNIITKVIASSGTFNNSATYNSGSTPDPNADNNYQSITLTINTSGTPTALTVNSASGFKGNTVNLIATLTDTQNNIPLEGKTIQFKINNTTVGTAITNTQGIATLPYTITENYGTYTILAQFLEDTIYTASSNTNILTVNHTPTALTVNSASGFKGNTVNLIATLTDTQNNIPLEGKTIQFKINNTTVGTAITNIQGIATLPYTITQNYGTYTILAQFLEDTIYTASSNTNILNVLDSTGPVVTSTSPANNAVNVALNKVIQINFNEAIKFGSNQLIELYKTGSGENVLFTSSIVDNVLSITPNSLLATGTQYTVILHPNSITDMIGNGLATDYTTKFTTTTPPVVTSTSPANNAVNVALNKVIQIKFNKNIKFGTDSWIELKTTNSGTAKPFTATITGSSLYIKPTTQLARGTSYTVIIHSNAVTDTTGTAGLVTSYTIKFRTRS